MLNHRVMNSLLLVLPAVISGMLVQPGCAAAQYKLPDTGQTKCYDATGKVVNCSGSGQDGGHVVNPMSYTLNVKSDCAADNALKCTVTDDNTGLVWQSYAESKYDWYQSSGTYHSYCNPKSISICGDLVLGGYTDWRMPTRKELLSIVDYSVPDPGPTVNAKSFLPTHTTSYWSYNEAPSSYMTKAWGVEFAAGKNVTDTREYESMYLRCVRGTQAVPVFVNNQDGTIADKTTGLVWQQDEPGAKTWSEAISYCDDLSLAGHVDWRLPNIRELVSLVDDNKSKTSPALDTAFFPKVAAANYWSSTSYATTPSAAWVVSFGSGGTNAGAKSSSLNCRCVRTGNAATGVVPTVTTSPVSAITSATASGGGKVTSDGKLTVTSRGVCWSTAANPDTGDSCTSDGTGKGKFTSSITGLTADTTYHVRAYAVNSAGAGYGKDMTFTTSAITVTSPDGGEEWIGGNSYPVTWSYIGTPGAKVNIKLYSGKTSKGTIASGVSSSAGVYNWTIPAKLPAGEDYRIMIASASNAKNGDISDNPFTIDAPTITVDSPNGGESLAPGDVIPIAWSHTGFDGLADEKVKIQLYKGNSPNKTITTNALLSAGVFNWTIPASQAAGTSYRIKISSKTNGKISDMSGGYFSIGK